MRHQPKRKVGIMKTSFLALLALLATVASGCTTDQAASADTRAPDTTAAQQSAPVDQALRAASAYFAAFNDGDANAITALLAGTVEFSDSFTGSIPRELWEQRLAWNLAQSTKLASPSCYVRPDPDVDGGTEVACESATSNAQIQAVGARPVPTLVRFSVTPYGISAVREEYGRPDFLQATTPFVQWLEEKHPDAVEQVGFDIWESIDDAEEKGSLTRQYARRWAAWLEANCVVIPDLISPHRDSYLDDC